MLVLNDEQAMLAESAAGFLDANAPVATLRSLRDSADETGFSRDLWSEMARMGWAGILVPEDHGGLGFGHVGMAVLAEEMGRRLTAAPFLSSAVMAVTGLVTAGDETQQSRWLPAIAAGEAVLALALDEGRKHRPANVRATARPDGNGYRLDGEKVLVADGHVADALLVAARVAGEPGEPGGLALFLVPRDADGLAVERTLMVDSRNAARVTLDDVRVDEEDALGQIGDAYGLIERICDAGRTCLAAELSGVAQESFGRTCAYLKERVQFDRPIGSFQALQHRAAHLYCEIEMARSAVLAAAQALDAGSERGPALVALAKAKAGDVAQLAVAEALQIHGGMGMTDEFDIGLFMKRARVADEMLGDVGFHSDRIAAAKGF